LSNSLDGQEFTYRGKDYRLALLGKHQLYNAATVLETVEVLRKRGWSITDEAVREGLVSVKWPARLEILSRSPLFILDGGHNPQRAEALAESLKDLLPCQKAVFLVGVLADKDWPKMLELVTPFAREFVCVTPASPRALFAEKLAEYLTEHGTKATVCAYAESGVKSALIAAGEDGAVVTFGSLYLAGGVRTAFRPAYRKWLRHEKICDRDPLQPRSATCSPLVCGRILTSEKIKQSKCQIKNKRMKSWMRK
jgi:dihydrofolate synthase/folylpolyglutamate synthase